jgi:murein DD-endopeptidase MepM/ murein hydrolase activator NlpD
MTHGISIYRNIFILALLIISTLPGNSIAEGFSWPIDCIPGISCDGKKNRIGFPDIEGVGVAHSCGPASYTGHLGTDILVSSVDQQTQVLAAADGVVLWQEDGLFDRCPNSSKLECSEQRKSILTIDETTKASLGFNAGNYVVIEHVLGATRYLTLYAHLKSKSLRVTPGQRISRGEVLATVGSSGNSLTPHLHFGVFQQKGNVYRPVDPWKGECNSSSDGLWANNPPYQTAPVALLPTPPPDPMHLVKAQKVFQESTKHSKD